MVDLPPGFRIKEQAPAQSTTPAIPPGFRVKGTPPVDPNEGWGPPGAIVPVQFQEGTGNARWAVPGIVTDLGNALSSVTKAATGQYGLEVDPETGRPTTITNEMIGDAMGGASLGLTPLSPAAAAGAQFGKQVLGSGARRTLQRELSNAGIPLDQVGPRLSAIGQDAVVADLSPGMQARAAAIATMPGSGQKSVVDTLSARRAGSNSRIISDVDSTLGPAPVPSQITAEIDANKAALRPEYQAVFRGAQAVDTSPIALDLDSMVVNLRGDAQKRAKSIRTMLNVNGASDQLDPSPETLFQVRQAIDGLLATEQNPQAIGTMSYIRRQVDDLLADAVPGIKEVDAQYAELARQGDAVQTGQQLLDSGRTAPRPEEVDTMFTEGALPKGLQIGPSAEPLRLRQGARAEIDRVIGNNVRDINAMKRIVAGEGNWNRDRLATAFGQEKADRLLAILEREALYNATEQMGLAGSRTQVLKAAQDDILGAGPKANPVKSAANFRFGDAIAEAGDRGLGWISSSARENQNQQLAQALMSGQDNLPMLAALASRPAGLMQRAPLEALRASALQPNIPGDVGQGAGWLGQLVGLGR